MPSVGEPKHHKICDKCTKALETMIIRRTSAKFQGSILRRVAVDFTRHSGRRMSLDFMKSLENVVDKFFELKPECLTNEPVVKFSAGSGMGTAEIWALEGI